MRELRLPPTESNRSEECVCGDDDWTFMIKPDISSLGCLGTLHYGLLLSTMGNPFSILYSPIPGGSLNRLFFTAEPSKRVPPSLGSKFYW